MENIKIGNNVLSFEIQNLDLFTTADHTRRSHFLGHFWVKIVSHKCSRNVCFLSTRHFCLGSHIHTASAPILKEVISKRQPTAFSVLIRYWSTDHNLFSPQNGSSVSGTTIVSGFCVSKEMGTVIPCIELEFSCRQLLFVWRINQQSSK